MSDYVQNSMETHVGDNSDHGQGSGDQASCNVLSNVSGMPLIPPKLANNIRNPN